ncbi:hypothetical protein Tco_1191165, partial [Tanacetum coccineum]
MYVSGHVDIFDMVDIDLFTVVALNMMVVKLGYTGESEPMFYKYLRPLTSLDEGLYALAFEEDVRCLATLVISFKLIEVYIENGVTAFDSYIRAPRFRATIKEITSEPGSIAPIEHRFEKMLLLTWHDSSEPTNELVCESVTPRSLHEHDSNTPCKDSVCFGDVARSGVESFGLSHDESFGVDDLDLNLNKRVNLNVSQIETQSESHVSEELDVDRSQKPIVAEVRTHEPIVEEVRTQEPIMEDVIVEDYVTSGEDVKQGNGQEDESAPSSFFYDNEGIYTAYETEYDVQSSEDASTDDDDDEDEDFLVDEENEIVKPDADDVDVINADGFDSDPGNDDETSNYRRRRLAILSREVEGVINASGQRKVNPHIPIKAIQDQLQRDLEYSMFRDYVVELQSTNPNTTVKITVERNTDPSLPTRVFQRIYVCLGALKLGFRACRRDLLGLDGAFMKGPFPGQVLAAVGLDSNNGIYPLAYALVEAESKSSWCCDRQKGIIPAIKTVFPSAEHKYCLRHIHENMKQGWCGQAYKDLLWRSASATSVKEFEKCMLELKKMNPKAHEWLNKIPPEHWARSYFL